MEFKSREILDELNGWFTRLTDSFRGNKSLKHQDPNITAEYFMRDLLNLAEGWDLVNANSKFSQDHDSFDLCDANARIAVQVTTTTNAAKMRKTFKSFIGTHDSDYDRMLFAYPVMDAGSSKAKFANVLGDYPFDPCQDRIDLSKILATVADLDISSQEEVLQLVRKQLEPLGRALHFGSDAVLSALIDVIQYMTENAPLDEVESTEQDPDYVRKAERLAGHVAYLESQYSANAGLHMAVSQAREAIGYDQAKIARIQAWLKGTSISLLRKHGDDAGAAFDSLAEDLLKTAHNSGSDAEMTAVRFLLAVEFQACNLFPNPKI